MTNPFVARRPWAAFLIALPFSPILGMLYLGRARWAGLYLLLFLVLLAVFCAGYPYWFTNETFVDAFGYFEWPYSFLGAFHAAYLAWKHPHSAPFPWFARWYTIIAIPVSWVALVLLNRAFLYPPYYAASDGMYPTLNKWDAVLASRRAYDVREPQRGDVIAFRVRSMNVVYLKRIVGLPHDRVQMRHGVLFINGTAARQTIVSANLRIEELPGLSQHYHIWDQGQDFPFDDTVEFKVPDNCYFVLGDNRDNSMDSRSDMVGFVMRGDIVGKAVLKTFDGKSRHVMLQAVQ